MSSLDLVLGAVVVVAVVKPEVFARCKAFVVRKIKGLFGKV